jgi:Uma2 family endonuclease
MDAMTALFTRALYAQLPEGFPAQLIEGELVKEPAPTYGHMRFGSRIHQQLVALVGPDRALMSPVDVCIDEFNVYQPDLVVLREPADDAKSDVGIPLIAVEVLSASTRQRDREVKRHRLLAAGVREVWLVDADAGTIERWSADGVRDARGASRLTSRALPGLALTPDELFTPAQ